MFQMCLAFLLVSSCICRSLAYLYDLHVCIGLVSNEIVMSTALCFVFTCIVSVFTD